MPECQKTPNYGDNAFFAFLQEASEPCFSPELLQRFFVLSEYQPDHLDNQVFTRDSHGQAAHIEIHPYNGEQAFVDNVEAIYHSTHIKAGAKIGPLCIIGCQVTIGEGVELEPASRVDNGATLERNVVAEAGATFSTGSVTGEDSIIRESAEVGYDVVLSAGTVLKENVVATRDNSQPESFVLSSK